MSAPLDPYKAKAENSDLTSQEKIKGLHEVVSKAKFGMFTTVSPDGSLHSRAMAPAGPTGASQTTLVFISNDTSAKNDEVKNDSRVNVSFSDSSSSDWASYSGTARVTKDQETINKHWSGIVSAWFGDLKDGVHTGKKDDPRVSIIEVIPDEIRYWYTTSTAVSRVAQITTAAITGNTAAPGELRTITKEEIALTQKLN